MPMDEVSIAVESSGEWKDESDSNVTPDGFYAKAETYWKGVTPTVKGMLGGLKMVDKPDIRASHDFLDRYGPSNADRALDCGAGIGRVTKSLLLPRFESVDMVEVTCKFLDQADTYIGEPAIDRVGHKFNTSLHKFTPEPGVYDLIWIQWVIGHLTVQATVEFLRRCVVGLKPQTDPGHRPSVIVVKDNVTTSEQTDFDDIDSSYMRTHEELLEIFQRAGLRLLADERQKYMPIGIFPVHAFALLPADSHKNMQQVASETSI